MGIYQEDLYLGLTLKERERLKYLFSNKQDIEAQIK
jgi:hypothetical protein